MIIKSLINKVCNKYVLTGKLSTKQKKLPKNINDNFKERIIVAAFDY